MKSVTMCVQHATRVIPMTVRWTAGVPSIVEGTQHASIADTNTGIATITFRDGFGRKPVIVGSCEAATGEKITEALRDVTSSGFILEVINEAGSNADSTVDIHLLVFGFDSADEA
jgi:hypothetical protein